MNKRKLLLLMAGAMLTFSACAKSTQEPSTLAPETTIIETTTEAPTTVAPLTDQTYAATKENVKLLGRTFYDSGTDVRWLTYSGGGVEFSVTAKSLDMMLYGDSGAANSNETNAARYAVYLDGEKIIDKQMLVGAERIVIFEGEEEKTATVKLVKLSESQQNALGIKTINVTQGEIKPVADKDLYIEFVGDSITCGYGVDDEDRNNHFKSSTEDFTKTYAYKTAAALDADYSVVALSGHGIVSGYTGSGTKQASQLMSLFYENMGFCGNTAGPYRTNKVEWGFEREPDVIVINLGTNDNSYTGSDPDRIEEYRAGYVEFLKQVRGKNPNARIICALGLMGDALYSTVETAVSDYSKETGDSNVSAFHFDPIKSSEGYAADWHPTEATHERAAKELTEEIKAVLGL